MKRLQLFLSVFALALQAQITLIKDNTPQADIVFSEESKPAVKALNTYLRKATGTQLPVIKVPSARAKITFNVDSTMDVEAFKVQFPDASTIAISAGSSDGLKLAVWDFLERHLGIRWLFPGELGEVVPSRNTLAIPIQPYEDKPSFLSRKFSGGKPEHRDWQDQMRAGRIRVAFHHNLHQLFHPSEYADSHPEYYPVLHAGKRFIPTPLPNDRKWKQSWQPCFSAPGIAEAAAGKIIDHFKETGLRTYSLGINDTNNHCKCPACLAAVGSRHNFNGLPNYSATFLPFANKVAELVSEKYPDCIIGFLAYSCLLEPVEGIALHKNLVPFMTFDRLMWTDQEKEAAGHKLTERWKAISNQLAWSDYLYGRFYDLPRVYFHHQAQYLRWGYAHGIRHHYAEYYPRDDWHEGPKFYLAMKLLWNVNTDVDATLDEWYNLAVGEKAAPYLKEYYARLEDFWTTRVQSTDWFNSGQQYLDFKSTNYLEAYTLADLQKSEELLIKMVELSDNKARAQHFLDTFLVSKQTILSGIKRFDEIKSIRNRDIPLLFSASYDDKAVATKVNYWQRDYSHGTFSYDETGGRDKSGALVMDTTGSDGTPMCYLEYQEMGKPAKIKVNAWFKAVDLEKDAIVSITLKWLAHDSKGANDVKPGWLPDKYTVSKNLKNPENHKWVRLEVLTLTPDLLPCKLCIQLCVNHSSKGKVLVDDLQVFAD